MGKPRLTVRPAQWEELPTIGAALASVYSGAEAAWWHDQWPRLEPLRPGFSLAHHRVGVLNGHIIAHISVRPSTLRYGGAQLKVAALGKWICTQPEYIDLGYAQAVLQDALTYATEQRAHLAMLYLEDQHQLQVESHSFHSVMPVYRASFDAAELAQLQWVRHNLVVRPARFEDAPYLAAMFDQQWGGRLTLARSPELWLWRMQAAESCRRALVVAPEGDPPQGYIAGAGEDDAQLLASEQVEVVAATPQAGVALLAAAGESALQLGQDCICWLLPPDDGLIALAQHDVGVTLSAQYSTRAGWRARVLNGEALAKALLPELRAQLQHALPSTQSSRFDLRFDAEGVGIGLAGQRETSAHLYHSDFVQLLFGAVSPAALALRSGLSEASVHLMQAVFPQRIGAFGAWDWF